MSRRLGNTEPFTSLAKALAGYWTHQWEDLPAELRDRYHRDYPWPHWNDLKPDERLQRAIWSDYQNDPECREHEVREYDLCKQIAERQQAAAPTQLDIDSREKRLPELQQELADLDADTQRRAFARWGIADDLAAGYRPRSESEKQQQSVVGPSDGESVSDGVTPSANNSTARPEFTLGLGQQMRERNAERSKWHLDALAALALAEIENPAILGKNLHPIGVAVAARHGRSVSNAAVEKLLRDKAREYEELKSKLRNQQV